VIHVIEALAAGLTLVTMYLLANKSPRLRYPWLIYMAASASWCAVAIAHLMLPMLCLNAVSGLVAFSGWLKRRPVVRHYAPPLYFVKPSPPEKLELEPHPIIIARAPPPPDDLSHLPEVPRPKHDAGPPFTVDGEFFCCQMKAKFQLGLVGQRGHVPMPIGCADFISDWCESGREYRRGHSSKGRVDYQILVKLRFCSFCGTETVDYKPKPK